MFFFLYYYALSSHSSPSSSHYSSYDWRLVSFAGANVCAAFERDVEEGTLQVGDYHMDNTWSSSEVHCGALDWVMSAEQ